MDSLMVAARFVAFTCYLNSKTNKRRSPEAAGRYARANWKRFLPYVREDLEKLLTASEARRCQRPVRSASVEEKMAI